MFHSYVFPIIQACTIFPFAALLFTLPFLMVQYRKHGYVHKLRAFSLYLFLLYLMNAMFLVILPLPNTIHNAAPIGGAVQLLPFQFIKDIMDETSVSFTDPSTYLALLKERAFLQVLFNVLLTFPFGLYLRYYFQRGWVVCLLGSFLLSLFFEITQLTGIFGIYDHSYRVFDVDDLLMNTIGGMLGAVSADWIKRRLPAIDRLDAGVDLAVRRVTYTRRFLAFMIDTVLWMILRGLLQLLIFGGGGAAPSYYMATGLYFMVIPYVSNGYTLGKWLVRIRVINNQGKIRLYDLFVRYGLLYWLVIGLGLSIFSILCTMVFGSYVIVQTVRRKPLFYEKISGTVHQIK